MKFEEKLGDLILLAQQGEFDVIVHGANCFCNMGSGIAPLMAKAFGADKFNMEQPKYKGWINKLGNIDYEGINLTSNEHFKGLARKENPFENSKIDLIVVNAYSQYGYGSKNGPPLDYQALELIFRKLNHSFAGKHIGLPLIGCGLAGGIFPVVKAMIQKEFKDMDVTIVHFDDKYL